MRSNPWRRQKQEHGCRKSKGKREEQSACQISQAVSAARLRIFGSYEPGECSLKGSAAQGKTDTVKRIDKLIKPHGLCGDLSGQIDPLKKAGKPGGESGSGQRKRTKEQGMVLFVCGHGTLLVSLLIKYIDRGLTKIPPDGIVTLSVIS